jgi:hypothetical protein
MANSLPTLESKSSLAAGAQLAKGVEACTAVPREQITRATSLTLNSQSLEKNFRNRFRKTYAFHCSKS